MTTCRTCGAPIAWATTESGAKMPVNLTVTAEAKPNLRIVAGSLLGGNALVAVAKAADPEQPLYTSHFATCPKAAQHRRPRKKVRA